MKPIVIGRHAFGDQYRATDFLAPGAGKLQLVFTPEGGGKPITKDVYDFKGKGVALSMYNTDDVCTFLENFWDFVEGCTWIVNHGLCPLFVQDGAV